MLSEFEQERKDAWVAREGSEMAYAEGGWSEYVEVYGPNLKREWKNFVEWMTWQELSPVVKNVMMQRVAFRGYNPEPGERLVDAYLEEHYKIVDPQPGSMWYDEWMAEKAKMTPKEIYKLSISCRRQEMQAIEAEAYGFCEDPSGGFARWA